MKWWKSWLPASCNLLSIEPNERPSKWTRSMIDHQRRRRECLCFSAHCSRVRASAPAGISTTISPLGTEGRCTPTAMIRHNGNREKLTTENQSSANRSSRHRCTVYFSWWAQSMQIGDRSCGAAITLLRFLDEPPCDRAMLKSGGNR